MPDLANGNKPEVIRANVATLRSSGYPEAQAIAMAAAHAKKTTNPNYGKDISLPDETGTYAPKLSGFAVPLSEDATSAELRKKMMYDEPLGGWAKSDYPGKPKKK